MVLSCVLMDVSVYHHIIIYTRETSAITSVIQLFAAGSTK